MFFFFLEVCVCFRLCCAKCVVSVNTRIVYKTEDAGYLSKSIMLKKKKRKEKKGLIKLRYA